VFQRAGMFWCFKTMNSYTRLSFDLMPVWVISGVRKYILPKLQTCFSKVYMMAHQSSWTQMTKVSYSGFVNYCFWCCSKWRTLHQPLVEEDFGVVLATVAVVEDVDVGVVEVEVAGEVVAEKRETRNGSLSQSSDVSSRIWRSKPLRRSTFSRSQLRYV